jgi:hypothetical protein
MVTIYGNRYRSMVCLYMMFLAAEGDALGYAGQRDQCDFVYRAFTFCGGTFQSLRLSPDLVTLRKLVTYLLSGYDCWRRICCCKRYRH